MEVVLDRFPPQILTPGGTVQQPCQEQRGMSAARATAVKTLAGAHSFLTSICAEGASSKMMTSSLLLTSMVRMENIMSFWTLLLFVIWDEFKLLFSTLLKNIFTNSGTLNIPPYMCCMPC